MRNLKRSTLFIHKLAEVQSNQIGAETSIWQFAVVLKGAVIGKNCNINCHTFIENDVVIGNNVTVKSGVFLWDGIVVEDDVFIGPNATFVNDKSPRSKKYPDSFQNTLIKKGATVGANATIIGGIVLGKYSLIGAGAVVTKSVPDHAMVYGNPAIITGWVDEMGNKLEYSGDFWIATDGKKFSVKNNQLNAL